jgi:hypothetical protein
LGESASRFGVLSGAEYVLLDTYKGKPHSMPDPEVILRSLAVRSREVLDLQK